MISTATRTPLTRDRIIDAAVVLADSGGVDELSMRKLGAELGVEAMSLYNHVENKDDILDGMIDHVFRAIPLPDGDSDWRFSIRESALAALDQFVEHPWMVNLLMQRGMYGLSSLGFMDRVLGLFRRAGFTDEDAHHAWQMLASHTMGYAFQQASGGHDKHEWESSSPEFSVFPNLAALAPYLANCEFGIEFAFGLEIIIAGLAARLEG
ncbi:MAG: TetR/AcrR family transcriptional regulator [Acidimicrobiia bacterium]